MKKFTRIIEDFVCGNCGFKVKGTGYTNHCPKCLYSKHVDINPGDRQALCQGLMKPIDVEMEHGKYVIIHKCLSCRAIQKTKTAAEDDFEQIIKLTK